MVQKIQGHRRGNNTRAPRHIYMSGLAAGASVMTLDGALPVEFLHAGDRLVTLDHGMVKLRAITARPAWKPDLVRVNSRALAPTSDTPDFWIAAHQPLLIRDWRAQAMFGRTRVMVPANRMLDGEHMRREKAEGEIMLFQLHFEATHLLRVGGLELTSTKLRGLQKASQHRAKVMSTGR